MLNLTFGSTAAPWSRLRFPVEHWVEGSVPDDFVPAAGDDFYNTFNRIRTSPDATPDVPSVLYLEDNPSVSIFPEYYDDVDTPTGGAYETEDKCTTSETRTGSSISLDPDLLNFFDWLTQCGATWQYTCQAVENSAVATPPPYIGLFPASTKGSASAVTIRLAGSGFPAGTYSLKYTPVGGSAGTIGSVTVTGSTFTIDISALVPGATAEVVPTAVEVRR